MSAYTTSDFATSIRRELKLRKDAYPKMQAKKEKQWLQEAEDQMMNYAEAAEYIESRMINVTTEQRLQYELLDDALRAIEDGQPLDTMHANAVLKELIREMKCRKSYYGFLVWKKRITKETADYEKSVWAALIDHWKENYCTPARDDWYFDAGKEGYQSF